MENITKEYCVLFNAVSDCIKRLQELETRLVIAQQAAEEIYIDHRQ